MGARASCAPPPCAIALRETASVGPATALPVACSPSSQPGLPGVIGALRGGRASCAPPPCAIALLETAAVGSATTLLISYSPSRARPPSCPPEIPTPPAGGAQRPDPALPAPICCRPTLTATRESRLASPGLPPITCYSVGVVRSSLHSHCSAVHYPSPYGHSPRIGLPSVTIPSSPQ
jgi:hypothetical protein